MSIGQVKVAKKKLEFLAFLKEYLADPKAVGGFAPSSKRLAEMVTDAAGVRDADVIVELGPGTGVFTEVIARKLKPGAKCIAIELREDFVTAVQERCPKVRVCHGSATEARKFLAQAGVEQCDCIISGLPFALFEEPLQNAILDAAMDILKPGGTFVTFTYFLAPCLPRGRRLRRSLLERFERLDRTRTVWLNVFPAFAYKAVKK